MRPRPISKFALAAVFTLLLAACGGDKPDAQTQQTGEPGVALPKPAQPAGSVTGMSASPGPGEVPLSGEPPESAQDPVDLINPETGVLPGVGEPAVGGATAAVEPAAQDAVAVIRDYYASIDSGSYARAWSLWSDGGRASGQTPRQFADGFARTAHVTVDTGAPENEDAGAGQRYIQVSVTVTATQGDGSVRRYLGSYTLHRTVVDGATTEQRAWRIASADLHEVQP